MVLLLAFMLKSANNHKLEQNNRIVSTNMVKYMLYLNTEAMIFKFIC